MFTTNRAQTPARRRKLTVLAGAVAVLVLAVARVDTAAASPSPWSINWGDWTRTWASAGCSLRMVSYWDARRSNWTLAASDWADIYSDESPYHYSGIFAAPQTYVKFAIYRAEIWGRTLIDWDSTWGAIPKGPVGINAERPWAYGAGAFTVYAAFKHNGAVMDNGGRWYAIGTLVLQNVNGSGLVCFN
jgi:hypothetical protein